MKNDFKKFLGEYAAITAGTLLVCAGVYFFKFPNNFSTGGVTGVSMIAASYIDGLSPSMLVLILNVALLILGFAVLGRAFTAKTVYSSLLMSAVLNVLDRVVPLSVPLTDEPLVELVFAVGLPALGSAILFNFSASTGGTDIVAMILKKYTSLPIGTALFCSDAVIVALAYFTFGVKTGLFATLGLISKAFLVDGIIESINSHKCLVIVTTFPEEISAYINKELHKGATVWDAKGAFTHDGRAVILAVRNNAQAIRVRREVRRIDPHSFTVITKTSEIVGKGFRTPV